MKGALSSVRRVWPGVVVGVIVLILMIALGSRDGDSSVSPGATPAATSAGGSGSAASDGLPTVAMDDLPDEGRTTIGLIDQNGPYPYDQDDSVFRNREGRLPDRPQGTYREYTVKTPGESDRGARRIVKARDGTLYYTDDHYESFKRVQR